MKLTVQHVWDATQTLAKIINEARPMPQKGKYRLARMHAKLLPEFQTINERREEMIKAYGTHVKVRQPVCEDPLNEVDGPDYMVPADKMEEFTADWKKFGADEIDVAVEPIPLACLDLGDGKDGSIQAAELITLGELVSE